MPLPSLPALPTWSQTKSTTKTGFDKVYHVVDKLGAPVNKLSNKLGSEAFWPTTLDKESDKAARILRSFCKDGFYVEQDKEVDPLSQANGQPKGKQRVIKKIPIEVIKKAKGLAIFTTMRTGLWISGAGGSGVLVGRQANGEWSPPSGILLHTAGLGFLIGVDIYDCVVVINTEKALEAFTKIRCTLGGEVSAVAGPVGMGGILETELHKRQAPVFNYLKSRGFYAGVQIDGTVIIERQDENERFYGQKMTVSEILSGKARHPPPEIKTLMMTIKAAQGEAIDDSALPDAEPTPGDYEIESPEPASRFGLPPSEDDPDPFGAKALEEEGMIITEIKPSGHKSRPSMEAFEYKPAPSSPIFKTFDRSSSISSFSKGHHKRDSGRLSIASIDRATQTELPPSPRVVQSPTSSPKDLVSSPSSLNHHSPIRKTSENLADDPASISEEEAEADPTKSRPKLPEGEEPEEEEEPQVFVATAKMVSIPKRIPPALPPRSPARGTRFSSELSPRSPSGLGIDITPHIRHQSINSDWPPPPAPPTDEQIESQSILHYHPKLASPPAAGVEKRHAPTSPEAEKEISPAMTPIDEKLNTIHLAPRREDSESISAPSHRSSISEMSQYSHDTPAATPIKLEDNEAKDGLAQRPESISSPLSGNPLVAPEPENGHVEDLPTRGFEDVQVHGSPPVSSQEVLQEAVKSEPAPSDNELKPTITTAPPEHVNAPDHEAGSVEAEEEGTPPARSGPFEPREGTALENGHAMETEEHKEEEARSEEGEGEFHSIPTTPVERLVKDEFA